jgi:hypothetical protein
MKKLFFAAACALAMSGCAEMAQQGQSQQASEKTFTDPDDYVTGSRIARKAPRNPAPAAAPTGGGGSTATSATR